MLDRLPVVLSARAGILRAVGDAKADRWMDCPEDVLDYLDSRVKAIDWDAFYTKRDRPATFLTQNDLPDESLLAVLRQHPGLRSAVELGCGEGRNAVAMAEHGLKVTAVDSSQVSIDNARALATQRNVDVDWVVADASRVELGQASFDFAYDSGLFHHLPPHRRMGYRDKVHGLLKPDGLFGLTCFRWGADCGEEVDDWEFYDKPRAGVAFTAERLRDFFAPCFEAVEIRPYQEGVPGTIQGLGFLWCCLFRKRGAP